jgi:lipopolysaccharide/colanic/teichoic acid biosynthesis glycosyltransferase
VNRDVRRVVRAGLDRVIAGVILVGVSPLILLLAVLIRMLDGKPVFFVQDRIGLKGRPFRMFKLRTMTVDSDPYMRKPDDADPVVTAIGRFMRGRALDELPQLWNVMRGEMALVGPRPEMPFVVEDYGPVEELRLQSRPGLTGLWQLSRVRDRAIEHHMEYDLFYVYNRSIGFDLWLLWRTALFAATGRATQIRLAAKRWERNTGWRKFVPDRSKAISRRKGPLLSRHWVFAGAGAFVFLILPSIVMAVLARGDLVAARDSLLGVKTSLAAVDLPTTRTRLAHADAALAKAERRLSSWMVAPGRVIPGLAGNLDVARALAQSGRELVAAGRDGLPVLESLPFTDGKLVPPLQNGTLDLAAFAGASEPAVRIQGRVDRAERLVRASGGALLLPQVTRSRQEVLRILHDARDQADLAMGAAFLIPRVFGSEGPRTWLLGAENTAELRGRGGYIGAFGTVQADKGKVEMGQFFDATDLPLPVPVLSAEQTPEEFDRHYRRVGGLGAWQNLGMSPHFPSTASVVLSTIAATGEGPKASGLISVDPTALSYLLEVTGPVRVDGIPGELTAGNVVDWTLNRLYFQFQKKTEDRKEAIAGVAQVVWERLVQGSNIDPKRLAGAVGKAIAERHLVVYSTDPEEQALIERLGMGGEVDRTEGDYLLVVGQNMGENKMDYYLQRDIKYQGRVAHDGSLEARLDITVTNKAPSGALPSYVAGPRPRLKLGLGEARSYLNILVPAEAELQDIVVDGQAPKGVDNQVELGRRVFGVTLTLGPGQQQTVRLRYHIPNVLVNGRYELTLQNQATVRPDDVAVDVQVPTRAITGAREGFLQGQTLSWRGPVQADTRLAADVRASFGTRLAARIADFVKRPIMELEG